MTRRRSAKLFIVAEALFAAVALGGCSLLGPAQGVSADPPTDDPPTSARTTTPKPKPKPSPIPSIKTRTVQDAELVSFVSPSGNIHCELDTAQVRCEVDESTWKLPPKPATCHHLDWIAGLEISGGTASGVCAGDSVRGDGGSTLAYGHALQNSRVRCVSESTGMTCTDRTSKHGFTLSRSVRRTF